MKWWRKAAEQENAVAQYNLGVCYANSKGVVKNEAEAMKWYRKAAVQGDKEAQFSLGESYDKCESVPKKNLLAYQWYLLASANGNETARENVPKLEAKLTAEQRAEGQRLATEWQAAFEKRQVEK